MKKLFSLLLASALLVPSLFAADFEGTVKMKLSGSSASAAAPEMTYSIKGTATRLDLETATKGGRVAMLMDSTKQEMTILMLDRKMFMKQDIPKAVTNAVEKAGDPDAKVEKTSQTEKIAGYDCTKYIATTKTGTTEMWLTDQLGAFPGLGRNNPMAGGRGGRGGGAPSALGWENALAGMNAFPLRVISNDGTKEVFRMEATAVEKKSLPESTFTPPSDFQDLSAMMKGMGGFGR